MFVYELIINIFFKVYILNKDLYDEYIKKIKKKIVGNVIGINYKKNLIIKNVEYMIKKILIYSIERFFFCIDKNINNSNELD